MKRFCVLSFFLFTILHLSSAQDVPSSPIQLEYIHEFNIKIDGGATFYTYDTTSLDTINYMRYILVISNKRVAFIKIKGMTDYVYMHADSPIYPTDKDTSVFEGGGYQIRLNTHKEEIRDKLIYKGSLEIKHNKEDTIIQVKGIIR